MKTHTDLLQERARVWEDAKHLLEKAEAESRDLTSDEQEKWDKMLKQMDELKQRAERLYTAACTDRAQEEPFRPQDWIMPQLDTNASRGRATDWVDRKTGKRVRALKRGETFADGFRPTGVDDFRGLTFGGFLRSMVLGPTCETERRALSEGTDSAGGFSVPTVLLPAFVDGLRAASVAFRAGATTLPIESDTVTIAKLLTDPTAAWHSENAAVSDSSPTFGAITFTPRTLVSLVRVSRELAEDSLNLETALNQAFAGALAAELDRVILRGSGVAPEPQGIDGATDANMFSMGANGAALTNYDPIVEAIELIKTDNVEADITGLAMHPREWAALAELKDSNNQPLQKPDVIADIPSFTTTNIRIDETQGTASNASKIFLGHWPDVMVGIRTDLRIEILKDRFADNFQFGFLAYLRADVQFRQAKSMGYVLGIIP